MIAPSALGAAKTRLSRQVVTQGVPEQSCCATDTAVIEVRLEGKVLAPGYDAGEKTRWPPAGRELKQGPVLRGNIINKLGPRQVEMGELLQCWSLRGLGRILRLGGMAEQAAEKCLLQLQHRAPAAKAGPLFI
jgi:hypothetical protein